jgi:oligosaccharyltransferase complex subunit gamma
MILVFTSGYMWNKIKNAPYVNVGRDGKVNWIAGGFQNQLGLESQVVAGICEFTFISQIAYQTEYHLDGVLAFTIVALTVLVPAQGSPQKQRIGVYLWLGMLVIVFSILMKLFKVKNPGYPYALLL